MFFERFCPIVSRNHLQVFISHIKTGRDPWSISLVRFGKLFVKVEVHVTLVHEKVGVHVFKIGVPFSAHIELNAANDLNWRWIADIRD